MLVKFELDLQVSILAHFIRLENTNLGIKILTLWISFFANRLKTEIDFSDFLLLLFRGLNDIATTYDRLASNQYRICPIYILEIDFAVKKTMISVELI